MEIWNRIAKLAQLKITDKERDTVFPQMQNIIQYFNNIADIPTQSVEPLINPLEENTSLREDQVVNSSSKKLLNQAPELQNSFVKVPLVIDSEES